jgi:protoheme IX farnesyltransferase
MQPSSAEIPARNVSTAPAEGADEAGGAIGANVPAADAIAAADARTAPPPRARSILGIWAELTKVRLNALVLVTTAVGYALGQLGAIDWITLAWTCAGTALAAASASLFNQLFERRRDALMHRTRGRPLPARQIGPASVFTAAVIAGYAGTWLLVEFVGMLPAGLAALNILLYAILYTPLKPRTTFNTLVGAVCGAIPPVIGWTAATGQLDPGAWLLGGILFVWQLPHFLALAWLYRADYARGGHAMLPVRDHDGEITAQVVLLTTLPLIPLGATATMLGLAGLTSAVVSVLAGLAFTWLAIGFFRRRDDASARRVFLGSIAYLPLVLAVMTIDRGAINAPALLRGRIEVPVLEIPATGNAQDATNPYERAGTTPDEHAGTSR